MKALTTLRTVLIARAHLKTSLAACRTVLNGSRGAPFSRLPVACASTFAPTLRASNERRRQRRFAAWFGLPLLMTTSLLVPNAHADAATPVEKRRKDYRPSPFSIDHVDLDFDLQGHGTIVTTRSKFLVRGPVEPLKLDGEDIELLSVSIDGQLLSPHDYTVGKESLVIHANRIPTKAFELETRVRIHPDENTHLSGLYQSSGNLCTQCEAEGFRRITYFLDRPDIMARYRVRLTGDKAKFPILLSNGNQVEAGELEDGRHFAVWEDPFPKPSYLFALVAGNLGSVHDEFVTASGRRVKLGIYSEHENIDKLNFAMYSLKASMKWDEDAFGRECDLDNYNIVAVNDFNMGAMENKGLNIFNTQFVLAKPSTATDVDYDHILGVIGHEYFHNWTGNRVTVRDWFQLTLKEGLTVFRDQSFSSDMTSRAVKRIEDVRIIRGRQFQEDSGPMAHPIRPDSYIKMDNFYTITVYCKGAEVIRMYETILGKEGFRKGMDLYFQRHDGQAVTCDDFRAAMSDANGVNLDQFERWYLQAGTPTVHVNQQYDPETRKFRLTLRQSTPATPGQPEKLPFHIPVVVGLLAPDGAELVPSTVLHLKENEQTFEFDSIPVRPIASVLRDFSAPVKLDMQQTDEELAFLMAHDTDSFNRWDAGQRLSTNVIMNLVQQPLDQISLTALPPHYIAAYKTLLSSAGKVDDSLLAYALMLPDEVTINGMVDVIDPDKIHAAINHVKKLLAVELRNELSQLYNRLASYAPYVHSSADVGRRRLRNVCLDFLCCLDGEETENRAYAQYVSANCMTDKIAALSKLVNIPGHRRDQALQSFHADANGDPLVLNKWFSIQASANTPDTIDRVRQLADHPDFTLRNPNRIRSLLAVFGNNNNKFHSKTGQGYEFLADMIIRLDKINPQLTARLAQQFALWRKYDNERQTLMRHQLERIRNSPDLSKDTYEVVTRCLN